MRSRAPQQEQTNHSYVFQSIQSESTFPLGLHFHPTFPVCSFACIPIYTRAFLISREAYRRGGRFTGGEAVDFITKPIAEETATRLESKYVYVYVFDSSMSRWSITVLGDYEY